MVIFGLKFLMHSKYAWISDTQYIKQSVDRNPLHSVTTKTLKITYISDKFIFLLKVKCLLTFQCWIIFHI